MTMRETPSPSCLAIERPPVVLGIGSPDGAGVDVAGGSVFGSPAVTAGAGAVGATRISGSRTVVPAGIAKTQRTRRAWSTGGTGDLASVAAQAGRSTEGVGRSRTGGAALFLSVFFSTCSGASALTTSSGSGSRTTSEGGVAGRIGAGASGTTARVPEAVTGAGARGGVDVAVAGGFRGGAACTAGAAGGPVAGRDARGISGSSGVPDEGAAVVATAGDVRRQSMTSRNGL